jgi:D-cysteine desulfhydrase family pyridoxal phosphate-dependent enzyme
MIELSGIAELEAFPRVPLAHTPTPLERAPNLGARWGINLYIKRDDCTGLALGGNKARQLEYYLGQAQSHGADVLLITGAVQSNFVRAAAAAARKCGLDIHIQLESRVDDASEAYQHSGNVLLDRLFGATLHFFSEGEDEAGADSSLQRIASDLSRAGRRPYIIHLGPAHSPIGALGYVRAGHEMAVQLSAPNTVLSGPPSAIVVPSGSGLTHAGLLVGLRACGIEVPVIGVCVRRAKAPQHARVLARVREVEALLDTPPLVSDQDVVVHDDTLAPGYGQMSDIVFAALDDAAKTEGLLLDPVYSAKCLAGLGILCDRGMIATGSTVVFLHTGGQPALFGYRAALAPYLERS